MGEAFAMFFVFIAVMSISLVLFSGWLAVVAVRGVGRLFLPLVHRRGHHSHICARCRQVNPPPARYCRRCGEQLQESV